MKLLLEQSLRDHGPASSSLPHRRVKKEPSSPPHTHTHNRDVQSKRRVKEEQHALSTAQHVLPLQLANVTTRTSLA